jgi:hypothetical protein
MLFVESLWLFTTCSCTNELISTTTLLCISVRLGKSQQLQNPSTDFLETWHWGGWLRSLDIFQFRIQPDNNTRHHMQKHTWVRVALSSVRRGSKHTRCSIQFTRNAFRKRCTNWRKSHWLWSKFLDRSQQQQTQGIRYALKRQYRHCLRHEGTYGEKRYSFTHS